MENIDFEKIDATTLTRTDFFSELAKQENLTESQIAICFVYAKDSIMQNNKIKISKPLIVKYVEEKGLKISISVFERPEVKSYREELINFAITSHLKKYVCFSEWKDEGQYYRLLNTLLLFLDKGIELTWDNVRTAFQIYEFAYATQKLRKEICEIVSKNTNSEVPEDLI